MKFHLPLTFSLALMISCSAPEKPKEEMPATAQKDSLISERDTFYIGNRLFYVEQIPKMDYDKIAGYPRLDTSEKNLIALDSTLVRREGNSLFMKLKNGNAVLKDNTDPERGDYLKYSYCGRVPEFNKYLIFAVYFEGYEYLLIDCQKGDTAYLCSEPTISPGKKYLIAGNTDLMAGFVTNGFDLFMAENNQALKIGRRDLTTWGPQKIKWMNDSVLFVQRSVLDTTAENMTRTDYVKLLMK